MKKVLITLLGVFAGTSTAIADMPASKDAEQWKFGLGIGVETQLTPYLGISSQSKIMPGIMIDAGNFSMRGPNLAYRFFDNNDYTVSALARVREEYLDSDDSRELEGVLDRDETIEMGLGLMHSAPLGNFTLTYYQDIEGIHDGYEVSLGWAKPIKMSNNWKLTPYTKINLRSDDLNNYYFGVSSIEANVDRLEYTAGSSTDFQVGISSQYKISPKHMFIFDAGFNSRGTEISDSPIVDKSSSGLIKAIYIYRF